ncbi:hypothetical protein BDV40DRAFT_3441 [Aspergillus tamarii]|uniref:Uncharacterized protein n=1 Tax=Aspergillus tamarii TaxID=41984 RepID=A0A5N6V8Z1_ASPTM|nr:hypothetical protein BDV40DRAFT_3441 [Aspergillus tamarii]
MCVVEFSILYPRNSGSLSEYVLCYTRVLGPHRLRAVRPDRALPNPAGSTAYESVTGRLCCQSPSGCPCRRLGL